MEWYFKRKAVSPSTTSGEDMSLPSDPAKRKDIADYHPYQRYEVRRAYLKRGPCQPDHKYKKIPIGNAMRKFNPAWFDQFDDVRKQGGIDAFVKEGFNSWNKSERLHEYVSRPPNSSHLRAVEKCENLKNQRHSITHALFKQDDVVKNEYQIRLNASIDASRYLLRQELPLCGHDETEESANKRIFLQLVQYTGEKNKGIRQVILSNAPKNNQMVSPVIQKDIVHSFAEEVLKSIFEEIDHGVFGLLVDKSAYVSHKEQMGVVFRFVDKSGIVKERFIGVVHVKETSSLTLKSGIDDLFAKYGMSLTKVRGQGYDGASNMNGKFNRLRSLISKESHSAYYVHCFAHQLQLVVVAIAKENLEIGDFFYQVSTLFNVVGASCKWQDMVQDIYREALEEGIRSGDIKTGTYLNQELSLQRPEITR